MTIADSGSASAAKEAIERTYFPLPSLRPLSLPALLPAAPLSLFLGGSSLRRPTAGALSALLLLLWLKGNAHTRRRRRGGGCLCNDMPALALVFH
jgi:hypothetical protein